MPRPTRLYHLAENLVKTMVRRSVLCSKELLKDRSWLVTGGQASIAQRVSKVENTTGRKEETVVLAVDGAPDLPRQRWQCGPPCVDPAGARERRPRSGHGVGFLAGVWHHDMGAPAQDVLRKRASDSVRENDLGVGDCFEPYRRIAMHPDAISGVDHHIIHHHLAARTGVIQTGVTYKLVSGPAKRHQ